MRHVLAVALIVSCLPVAVTGPAFAGQPFADEERNGSAPPGPTPDVVAAYPDPIADGDEGEFVVVSVPSGVDPGEYAFTDGEATVSLADASPGSSVAVANAPRARNLTDAPVLVAPSLALSNGGERLRVTLNDSVVDERRYRDAREGELVQWNGSRIRWRPLGATDRPVVRGDAATVRGFVLPDASATPLDFVRSADRRVLLAGYTFTSARVADALASAARNDVTVRVLLEGGPVGGLTRREARTLDGLVRAGVDVRVIGGPHARYAYHHAKYAVVDDRALVTTENWKPSGTGGNSSRGWGVVTNQPRIVDGLVETFRADAGWRDARSWDRVRRDRRFDRGERAVGGYPSRIEPEQVRVDRTELLVAPDNAQPELVRLLDGATESVDVVQVTLGDWDEPLSLALRRAATRGASVRILLSSAWYVRDDNRRTVARFEEWAAERDAPLTAKVADPGDRYEKIHAKGAIVDDRHVVLGSLNWNEHAATENREVVVVLTGDQVADFYGRSFDADWRGGRPRLPVGVAGAVLGSIAIAAVAARRLRFGS